MSDEIHLVVIKEGELIQRVLTAYYHEGRAEQAVYEVKRLGRLDTDEEYIDYVTRPLDRSNPANWFVDQIMGETDA